MTKKTNLLFLVGLTSLLLFVAFWFVKGEPEPDGQDAPLIKADSKRSPPLSGEVNNKHTLSPPAATAPVNTLDQNINPVDPNGPRPMPTVAPPMPSSPPPMPTIAPFTPDAPPEMPLNAPEMPK